MDRQEKIEAQKKAVRAWFDGMTRGDVDAAHSEFADDATWLGIGTSLERVEYQGKEAITGYNGAWVGKVWSELRYEIVQMVGDGEAVLTEWVDHATAPSGEEYSNRGVLVCEFDGGTMVARVRSYFDYEPLLGDHIGRFRELGGPRR